MTSGCRVGGGLAVQAQRRRCRTGRLASLPKWGTFWGLALSDRCIDCNDQPRLHQLGSCFSETFPVRAPSGAALHLTLRLCLRCGKRFATRTELRDYLRTRLPDFAVQMAAAIRR